MSNHLMMMRQFVNSARTELGQHPLNCCRRGFSTVVGKRVLISNTLGGGRLPEGSLDQLCKEQAIILEMPVNDQSKQERYEELITRIKSDRPHALFVGLDDNIDRSLIDTFISIQDSSDPCCISTMSVGFNHIDISHIQESVNLNGSLLTCRVGYTPGVLTESTADLVIGLMLATSRRMLESHSAVFDGQWREWHPSWFLGKDLHHSKVSFIGMGHIATAVAQRLTGFNCDIHYCNHSGIESSTLKHRLNDYDRITFHGCDMNECIKNSDFVVPLMPLSADTKHMIGEKQLKLMGNQCILINASRGDIIDQSALLKALRQGWIHSAGIDVCSPEPIPLDHPLLDECKTGKLTILPHIGSSSFRTRLAMAQLVCTNIIHAFKGTEPDPNTLLV